MVSAFRRVVLISFLLVVQRCGESDETANTNECGNLPEELVFQSGYEDCTGSPPDAHISITGADNSFTGNNDWEADLLGHDLVEKSFIWYEGGNSSQRYARIIPEPGNAANQVLHFWLNEPYIPYGNNNLKGRIQATTETNGICEMVLKHRIFLPADMVALTQTTETFGWLTIQEFWNNLPMEDFPFRISINIVKPTSAGELYFETWGQTKIPDQEAWENVWDVVDNTFSIPIGEWITLETYFREGNQQTGRFIVKATDSSGQKFTVADVTNFTHHPNDESPDGLKEFNPMKLYAPDRLIDPMNAAGKTLQLYWDDFELWLNKKPG